MEDRDVIAVLARLDLFLDLQPRLVETIRRQGSVNTYQPGDVVTVEDTMSDAGSPAAATTPLHIVLQGEAVVSRSGRELRRLGPGGYFGDLSVIDGLPRSATVQAGDETLTTFSIDRHAFLALLSAHPEVAIPMLRVFCARLRSAEDAPTS